MDAENTVKIGLNWVKTATHLLYCVIYEYHGTTFLMLTLNMTYAHNQCFMDSNDA